MPKKLSQVEIIENLRDYFSSREDVLFSFLFGSHAKRKAMAESDIDIAIYFKQQPQHQRVMKIWGELENVLHRSVDLIVLNTATSIVAWSALRGIPIVIKDHRFYLEYMLQVSREAEDFTEFVLDYWRWRERVRSKRLNPLNNEQKVSIVKRLSFLEIELKDLEQYAELDFETYSSDRRTRRDVERIIENIINACIDMAKILLSGEELPMPETYKEVFLQLGQAAILDKELARSLADLVRVRNILAHQYLDLKWDVLKDFISREYLQIYKFTEIAREKVEQR